MSIQRDSTRGRVALLAGQAFALGLLLAWVTIAASTIFLGHYGASRLPWTYLGAAVMGAIASKVLGRALRRRPLVQASERLLLTVTAGLIVAWLALWQFSAPWVSAVLVTTVPLIVPVGFMFVVGQAGLLLDVRALKALYPRVIAGFSLGVAIGGLAAPPLLSALGATEHLLAMAAAASGAMFVVTLFTGRTFHAELSVIEHDEHAEPVTIAALLANRFIVLIALFQILGAIESQWLDFLVFDRASHRYASPTTLATFLSRFSTISYGADIVVLLFIAGALMRRFGLRFGLTANAVAVSGSVVAVLVASAASGSGATLAFVLVVSTRVSDLVLTDAMSRTSLSAAYQVVPTRLRAGAQGMVESLAVPAAIGLSGVLLLVVQATVGTSGSALAVLTLVVLTACVVVASRAFRSYRQQLLEALRHRQFDTTALADQEWIVAGVIERLLDSADPNEVRLALEAPIGPDRAALAHRLDRLVREPRVQGPEQAAVRSAAVARLVEVDPRAAAEAALWCLERDEPELRRAGCDALAVLGPNAGAPAVSHLLDDPDRAVRVAAARLIASRPDGAGIDPLVARLGDLAHSADEADRREAGLLLSALPSERRSDDGLVLHLLADDHPDVVIAVLGAIEWSDDPALQALVIAALDQRATSAAALAALTTAGPIALEMADAILSGRLVAGPRASGLMPRLCREVGGLRAVEVLCRHAGHHDRDLGLAVLSALGSMDADTPDELVLMVLDDDFTHAGELLAALLTVGAAVAARHLERPDQTGRSEALFDPFTVLAGALEDELGLLARRVVAALSLHHGQDALARVAFQLAQRDRRVRALALEWLDVALTAAQRPAIALLEPDLAPAVRAVTLSRQLAGRPGEISAVLVDLALDPDDRWRRPWLSACGAFALYDLGLANDSEFPSAGLEADSLVAETVAGLRLRSAAG